MRTFSFLAGLSLGAWALAATAASSATVLTQQEAAERAYLEGYTLVSKTEHLSGAWDVWASKDGIPYEVKIDAHSGSVLAAAPVEDDD